MGIQTNPADYDSVLKGMNDILSFIDETESEEFIKREWHEIDRSLRIPKCLKVFYN